MDGSSSKNKCLWSWLPSEKELGVETKTTWGGLTYVNAVLYQSRVSERCSETLTNLGMIYIGLFLKLETYWRGIKRILMYCILDAEKNIQGVPFFPVRVI